MSLETEDAARSTSVTPRDLLSHQGIRVQRTHYLDWLRAIAVLGVLAYHALLPFAKDHLWMIRNGERSALLMAVVGLFETFGLLMLFVVAGASAGFALRTRSTGTFLVERAARLLVPFFVGTLLLGPVTAYITGLHDGTVSGSFVTFLPAYPRTVLDYPIFDLGISPALFQIGGHLWFLGWLFLFALLGVPIFAFLSSARGHRFLRKLSRLARWPGSTLLFAVPIGVPMLILFGRGASWTWDWWAFGLFGVTFLVGYVMYSDDRLIKAVRRDLLPALIVAVIGSLALLALGVDTSHTYSLKYFLGVGLYVISGWSWTLTLLGVGMRARIMQRSMHPRIADNVLPAYILHFPIVIAISFFVVDWPLGLWVKVLLNVSLSVATTSLVVLAATQTPVVRRLLGLRNEAVKSAVPGPGLSRSSATPAEGANR